MSNDVQTMENPAADPVSAGALRDLRRVSQVAVNQPMAGAQPRGSRPRSTDLEACVAGLVNAVDKGIAAEVTPYDFTSLEFSLLRTCMETGECTATYLAQLLPVDPARISRTVTRLVDRGMLVRRRLWSDRRVVMLRLSEDGNEVTSRVLRRVHEYGDQLTAGISEEELHVFADVTSRILANHVGIQRPR